MGSAFFCLHFCTVRSGYYLKLEEIVNSIMGSFLSIQKRQGEGSKSAEG